jgi:hypothetical protein
MRLNGIITVDLNTIDGVGERLHTLSKEADIAVFRQPNLMELRLQ